MTLRTRGRGDRGSGSVWVSCALTIIAAVAFAFTSAGAVSAVHARAVAAADLAALRAADVLQHRGTTEQACAAAGTIAALNGAGLESCLASGMDVEVSVVGGRAGFGGSLVRATSRAGPAGR